MGFAAADEVATDASASVAANTKDKENKTSLVEVNKLFSFDQSDDELRKMFQGVEEEDMKLFLEQKNNMTSLFAEADSDKDGHLSEDEVMSNDGLKAFLQEELANNDDMKRGFDQDGEFLEGDMKWGGDDKLDKMDDFGMGGGRGKRRGGKRGGKRSQFMDEDMNEPSPRGRRSKKSAKSGGKAKKTQS